MLVFAILWIVVLFVGIAAMQFQLNELNKKIKDLENEIYRLKIMR